ncbi:amphiregulin [Carettochelys insculpta]|uniref:amphiregulin n=1 Tax=Carettochelys insculpta TaxID=44489 RepID=UPI003EBD4024
MQARRVRLLLRLLLLSALAWLSACQHAAGLGLNATEPEENVHVAWDHGVEGHGTTSGSDYEDTEEEEEQDLTAPINIVDDSVRVQPLISPKQTKTEKEKNPDKTKRKRNKGKKSKKKKGTPCDGEYKNFCIHGECKYLEDLKKVSCKCHQDYFGERCGEQFMKTQKRNDIGNYSTTILVVVAVLLSSISFIAIVVIVIMQVRKTCPQYEEKEERKKLRQENGIGHVGV